MARSRTPKAVALNFRISSEEKAAFDRAAKIAGISLSSWIRERLRAASLRELDVVGELAPFLATPLRGKSNGQG
jgi:uncharacterized protein (DUF1778 family)